jgi:hypothetical protein
MAWQSSTVKWGALQEIMNEVTAYKVMSFVDNVGFF